MDLIQRCNICVRAVHALSDCTQIAAGDGQQIAVITVAVGGPRCSDLWLRARDTVGRQLLLVVRGPQFNPYCELAQQEASGK